jgi:hydrogenase maturation protease
MGSYKVQRGERSLAKELILGYGNVDRQDDGVAWHVLAGLCRKFGRPVPASYDDEFENTGDSPDLSFVLQITPELAEKLAAYDRVCFVDAHTGSVSEDLHAVEVKPEYQSSPFTHHMTPATCLSFVKTIYQRDIEGFLISLRGYEFGFSHELSPATASLAGLAVEEIYRWLLQ